MLRFLCARTARTLVARAEECLAGGNVDDVVVADQFGVVQRAPVLQEGLARRTRGGEAAELRRRKLEEVSQTDARSDVDNLNRGVRSSDGQAESNGESSVGPACTALPLSLHFALLFSSLVSSPSRGWLIRPPIAACCCAWLAG